MDQGTELIQRCLPLVDHVEQLLVDYYGFSPEVRAADYLQLANVGTEQLRPRDATDQAALRSRGYVTALVEDGNVYMAIGLDESVLGRLAFANPIAELGNGNLDALCVLAEELSHFHMLAEAIRTDSQVTRLGLEVQGEIDKLLVAALIARSQFGHPHMLPLARLIFDSAEITETTYLGYQKAHRIAAKTWYEIIDTFGDHPSTLTRNHVRTELIRLYRLHSHSKVESLTNGRWNRVA